MFQDPTQVAGDTEVQGVVFTVASVREDAQRPRGEQERVAGATARALTRPPTGRNLAAVKHDPAGVKPGREGGKELGGIKIQ